MGYVEPPASRAKSSVLCLLFHDSGNLKSCEYVLAVSKKMPNVGMRMFGFSDRAESAGDSWTVNYSSWSKPIKYWENDAGCE